MARVLSSEFGSVNPGTTFTINKPAGAAAGDILLLFYYGNQLLDSVPAGFANINFSGNIAAYWKLLDGSEGASFAFGVAGGGPGTGFGYLVAVRAARRTGPIDVSGVAASLTGPSVTPVRSGLLLGAYAVTVGYPTTAVDPTGMTRVDYDVVGDMALLVASQTVGASATGTRTATINNTGSPTDYRSLHVVVSHLPGGGWGVVHV